MPFNIEQAVYVDPLRRLHLIDGIGSLYFKRKRIKNLKTYSVVLYLFDFVVIIFLVQDGIKSRHKVGY